MWAISTSYIGGRVNCDATNNLLYSTTCYTAAVYMYMYGAMGTVVYSNQPCSEIRIKAQVMLYNMFISMGGRVKIGV